MTVIAKITVGKKNKSRYNIFIDKGKGDEFAFSVSEEVLIKMNLKKGLEINELDMEEIAYLDDIQKAYSASLLYLSHRMRSEAEVKRYLKEKDYEDSVIKEVLHKLHSHKYLDDLEFASALVRTRMNAGDKGPVVIRQEMKEKGLQEQTIEQALEQYDKELQIEHACRLAGKLAKKHSGSSLVEMKRKIEQSLLRKGYASSIIGIAMEMTAIEQDEDEEWNNVKAHGDKASRRFSKYSGYEFKQKVKSALYRKGFPMELIDRYLEETEAD